MNITVGFDGSLAGQEALRWAVGYAQDVPCRIQVVAAFEVAGDDTLSATRARIETMLDTTLIERADDVDLRALEGDPVEVLLRCSESSDLLVVGRHGTSQLIHNSMGSVGDACARLASCPVVIVPPQIQVSGD